MKSIKDLEAIRQRTLDEVNLRNDRHGIRVVVGMGTCGISAGARPVGKSCCPAGAPRVSCPTVEERS